MEMCVRWQLHQILVSPLNGFSADDAKTLSTTFEAQGIKSESNLLLITKHDLVEMKVSIGVRNRFLDAQFKSKSGGVPVAPVVAAPFRAGCICMGSGAAGEERCDCQLTQILLLPVLVEKDKKCSCN